MKCERCKENEANVQYTQIINGIKEELNLCETCAHKLGIEDFDFAMPIDFSNFFGEFLENDNTNNLFKSNNYNEEIICNKCKMTFDEFINSGKFGCDNCYNVFSNKIDKVLKRVHGVDSHVGRKLLIQNNEEKNNTVNVQSKDNRDIIKIEKLKNKLKQLIKEENYEEAAIVRDEIKKLEE